MQKMNKTAKFYEFKNQSNVIDLYIYGEIVSGADKWDESDVTFMDFTTALENLTGTETINMYINSIGGSVIATQGIIAMLQRAKDKGVTVNSYIDGIAASCASFLCLVADNVYTYNSSIMMIHHPMSACYGNINDFQAQIDVLNKIEDSVMMPIYKSKLNDGIEETEIKELIDKESWLDASEITRLFNITKLADEKELVACVDTKVMEQKFKNIPDSLKNKLSKTDTIEDKSEVVTKDLELLKAKLKLELL